MNICEGIGIPRPEYPRPDFERCGHWINLNGSWQFAVDPQSRGETDRWWEETTKSFEDEVIVPFCWQSLAAVGKGDEATSRHYLNDRYGTYAGVAWYKRQFNIPASFPEKDRVILHFGAVNWEARIWINDVFIGEHAGAYDSFEFDITEVVHRNTENVIAVRVFAPGPETDPPVGEFPLGKQVGNWFSQASGIWQTVWVESRPDNYLESVTISTTLVPPVVTFHLGLNVQQGAVPVGIRVLDKAGEIVGQWQGRADKCSGIIEVNIAVPDAEFWSVERPVLYDVTISVGSDQVKTYFGFRSVEVKPLTDSVIPYIHVNGQAQYIRGVLAQGYNPEGIYTYPSDEYIRQDLIRAKEFGFNLIRLHIKVEEPRVLYWADQLGLLVWEEVPNYEDRHDSPAARARWEQTLRAMIKRDYNHPATIIWGCFNETWGLRGSDNSRKGLAKDPQRQAFVTAMYTLVKQLDSSRLVVDNSACNYDHVSTDLVDWHHYTDSIEGWQVHLDEVSTSSVSGSDYHFVPGRKQDATTPLINTEYALIGRHEWRPWVIKDVSWGFKRMTEELRRHERITGYVYAELQDIEWETSCGLMTYDRRPFDFNYVIGPVSSSDHFGTQSFNGDNVLLIETRPQANTRQICINMSISKFCSLPVASGELCYSVYGTDYFGRTEKVTQRCLPVYFRSRGVSQLADFTVDLPSGLRVVYVEAWLISGDRELSRNYAALVLPSIVSPKIGLIKPSSPHRAEWSGGIEPLGDTGLQCYGAGVLSYRFPLLPEAVGKNLRFYFEISSAKKERMQSGLEKVPSQVLIGINGHELQRVLLADAPADARGVVSHLHGIPGHYGYLLTVDVPSSLQGEASETIDLSFSVLPNMSQANGLTVFGQKCGRYGIDLTMQIMDE